MRYRFGQERYILYRYTIVLENLFVTLEESEVLR